MSKKSKFLIFLVILFCIAWGLILCILSSYAKKQSELEKDKIIFMEKNSIGCSKYKLNGDIFWRCPKNIEASSIESRYCSGSGIHRNCRTEQEPVL